MPGAHKEGVRDQRLGIGRTQMLPGIYHQPVDFHFPPHIASKGPKNQRAFSPSLSFKIADDNSALEQSYGVGGEHGISPAYRSIYILICFEKMQTTLFLL